MHGDVGSWGGARVVGIATDPSTGWPMPSSELNASNPNSADLATGWDDGTHAHGRPAAVTFSPDGRLFVGNDFTGDVVWIAPVAAAVPADH